MNNSFRLKIFLFLYLSCCSIFNIVKASQDDPFAPVKGYQSTAEFYRQADLNILNGKKIGITIQTLSNSYWQGVMSALKEQLDYYGVNYELIDCENNSAIQVQQINKFVSDGYDMVLVHPSDAAALEDTCKNARNNGVKIMCWDDPMIHTDANWILNNTELGIAIGEIAGKFINEHFSSKNKAKVAVLGQPEIDVLLEREEGIHRGLERLAEGKYEIIATLDTLTPNEGEKVIGELLKKVPDLNIVTGIGSGPMIGADLAIKKAKNGKIPENVGVFTADVTKTQLEHLLDKTFPARGIVGFEGSDVQTAEACVSMFALTLSNKLPEQNVYRPLLAIDENNAEVIGQGMR